MDETVWPVDLLLLFFVRAKHPRNLKPVSVQWTWSTQYSMRKIPISASNFGKLFREKSVAPYFAGITFIVGLLILLTGLLNFFHFLTGSYLNRSHEFGIRKVNGSNGNKLFWLLFTQAIIISFIAFLLTFCLIEIFTPLPFISLFDFTLVIERDLLLIQTIEYMAGVILLCLLLCLFTVWRMKHAPSSQVFTRTNPNATNRRYEIVFWVSNFSSVGYS